MSSPVSILLSGAGLAVVRLAAGLLRAKWIAHAFGPVGVGLMAQATQFQMVAASAASFSTSAAIIQGVKGRFHDRAEELFRCAFLLILAGAAVLLAATLGIGFGRMGEWLLGPGYGAREFALVLLAVPCSLLSSCFLECAFFAHDRFDRYSITSAVHALLQSGVFIFLSWRYGLVGVLAAFPVSAALLLALFGADLARIGELRARWFVPRWDGELARFLVSHGAIMFATGVGGGFLLLNARAALVQRVGLDDNGMLQVPIALSAYGSAIMTNFLWGRVHPVFSAGGKHGSFELSLCTMTSFFVALGTWVAAPVLVPLIYSKAFIYAIPLIGLQCLGDIIHYSFFAMGVAMLASGRFSTYLLGWCAYYLPYLFLLFLPGHLHPHAFMSVHLAGSISAFAVVALLSVRNGPFFESQALRLVLLTGGLALSGGTAIYLSPVNVLAHLGCAIAAAAAGFSLWRYLYGPAVNEQVRQAFAWLRRRVKA